MAETAAGKFGSQFAAISRLTAHRQFGLVLGLAVVAALAIFALRWAMQPGFVMLLNEEAERDYADAQAMLTRAAIPYQISERSGALMVPQDRVREARIALAEEGLPSQGAFAFEFLTEGLPLGTSRTIENEAVRRALAAEIGRTIAQARAIRSAQVLLALPDRSVFLRDRDETKASVYLDVRGGTLDEDQIAGIAEFVAMSVPGLDAGNVAVMDSNGQVLSRNATAGLVGISLEQRDYTRRLEQDYRARIENLLAPTVGEESLRVSVTAEVDFTQSETATESYGADEPAVVSESITSNESNTGQIGGVPGALSNQPPAGGQVAPPPDNEVAGVVVEAPPTSVNRSSVRNFQNDRTLNYVREAPASLSRLSIAVVIDDRIVVDEAGERSRVGRTETELAAFETLVRDAVGFDEARGDQISVSNQAFREVEAPPPPEPVPLWQQPWVLEIARYVAAGLGILFLLLFVLRPTLKNLASLPATPALSGGLTGPDIDDAAILQAQRAREQATPLGRAQKFAEDDPKLVAHVVRQWIDSDGE